MKYLPGLLIAIICCQSLNAQKKDIFKNKPWLDFKNKTLLDSLRQQYYNAPAIVLSKKKFISPVLQIPLAAVYSGQNFRGDEVWQLKSYNMACLVPSKAVTYKMPLVAIAPTEIEFESPFNKPAGSGALLQKHSSPD